MLKRKIWSTNQQRLKIRYFISVDKKKLKWNFSFSSSFLSLTCSFHFSNQKILNKKKLSFNWSIIMNKVNIIIVIGFSIKLLDIYIYFIHTNIIEHSMNNLENFSYYKNITKIKRITWLTEWISLFIFLFLIQIKM